jgi:hypothetical protein
MLLFLCAQGVSCLDCFFALVLLASWSVVPFYFGSGYEGEIPPSSDTLTWFFCGFAFTLSLLLIAPDEQRPLNERMNEEKKSR